MDMTQDRWGRVSSYLGDVFGAQDEQRATLMERAAAAGIPLIAVSADVGRALEMFASMTNAGRGPRLALELGTLAGYSALWIARALAPGGRLITIEPEPRHADFAQREFDRAGVSKQVEIRRTTALEVLPKLLAEFGPASFDFVFIDAIKTEYPEYFRLARPLIAPGGVLAVDNALGSSEWSISEPPGSHPSRDGVDKLNRAVAADPGFIAACFPNREGLMAAWRRPGR